MILQMKQVSGVRTCGRLQLWVTGSPGHRGCGLGPQGRMTVAMGKQEQGGRGNPRTRAALSRPLRTQPAQPTAS